jgi:hypothetical protein
MANKYKYPIGKPQILCRATDLNRLEFHNNKSYICDKNISRQIEGLVYCSIIPPSGKEVCANTFIPFLLDRVKTMDGTIKCVAHLCSECAKNLNQLPCIHTEKQRSICSVYTLVEVAFAVNSCGYTILSLHEAHIYDQLEFVYKDFMRLIAKLKVQYSGFPRKNMPQAEREDYVKQVNANLNLNPEDRLCERDVLQNTPLRNFYKLLMNR